MPAQTLEQRLDGNFNNNMPNLADGFSNLERAVTSLFSKLWNGVKIAASTIFTASFVGIGGTVATIAAHYASDAMFKIKEFKKNFGERISKSTHQANLAASLRKSYFGFVNSFQTTVSKAGALLVAIAPFNMIYLPLEYAIETYKLGSFIKHIVFHPYKTMKDIYGNTYGNGKVWNTMKNAYLYLGLPLLGTTFFIPPPYQVATAAASAFAYKSINNLTKRKN